MSQQQQPPSSTGLLTGGIIVGLLIGGTVLTLILFLLFGVAFSRTGKGDLGFILAFICCYVVAVGLGVWAFCAVRKGVNFASGFLIGLAAGLLGGTALCNAISSGLTNMH